MTVRPPGPGCGASGKGRRITRTSGTCDTMRSALPQIWQQVQDGNSRLSPMLQVGPATRASSDGDSLMMWSAADALVLKWAALTVSPGLRTDPGCLHLQGGAQGAVRLVAEQLAVRVPHGHPGLLPAYPQGYGLAGLAGKHAGPGVPELDTAVPPLQHGDRRGDTPPATGIPRSAHSVRRPGRYC